VRPHGRQGAGADAGRDRKLVAARLAADVLRRARPCSSRAPTPRAATLLTPTSTSATMPFIASTRAHDPKGSSRVNAGIPEARSRRGLAYAPVRGPDLVRDRTSRTWMRRKALCARGSIAKYPGQAAGLQLLAVLQLEEEASMTSTIATLPARARRDGLQVPVHDARPGFHALNYSMFELARGYGNAQNDGVRRLASRPYSRPRPYGYTATKHQREVGAGYFDERDAER
jgi:isocitrate lyase